MIFSRTEDEKQRFKRTFAEELLQYHFEQTLGKNEDNEKQWRVLLDDHIEPHAEMLCDFSNWLLDKGWSREVVEELFFVAVERDEQENADEKAEIKSSQPNMTYISPNKYGMRNMILRVSAGILVIGLVVAIFFVFVK
jgi:hypothetical protein